MNSLTVSIIIPVYNEEGYLENCLDSIADQTVLPDEVIVVDNNSSDASHEIAKRYSFVTVISEKKQGIVYARNAGFNAASCDLIGRIDADTVLGRNWVEYVKDSATKLDSSTAVTGPCKFYENSMPRVLFGLHRIIYFWLSRLTFGHNILFGSNMFIFRKKWNQLGLEACIDNSIHEDMDLASHIVTDGGSVVFDKNLPAKISSRRFSNWRYYPTKWSKTWLAHGLISRTYYYVRKVYESGKY